MKNKFATRGLMAVAVLSLGAVSAQANDDALIDALVQKGVISQKEAADIKDKASEDLNTSAAERTIKFGDAVKDLTFYASVRIRAEVRDGKYGANEVNGNTGALYTSGGSQTRDRFRFRALFGMNGDLYDNFFFGLGFAENTGNQRSGNVTFGTSDSAGPFGKAQSIVAINRVFLGWKPTDYLTFQVGQVDNPFYSTNLTWDNNINPEGLFEQYSQDFGNLNVFGNAGQMLYAATSFDNTSSTSTTTGNNENDVFMLEEQIGLKYKIAKDIEIKGAVGVSTYTGTKSAEVNNTILYPAGAKSPTGQKLTTGTLTETETGSYAATPLALVATNGGAQPNDFAGPFTGSAADPYTNDYGINNLFILDAPMEIKFKLWKVPMKFYGDFAWNLDAQGRSNAAANAIANGSGISGGTAATAAQNLAILDSPETEALLKNNRNQDMAYEVGYQAGELKDKGDWMAKAYWLDREYYSVDPNLTDADIFDGRTNMEGFVLQGNYNITKGLTATVTYAEASRADKQLATPGTGNDLNIGSIDHYRLIQTDIMWKF